jgi:hypothetical protein
MHKTPCTGAVSLGDETAASIGETDKPADQFRSYTEDVMEGLVMATYQTINTRQTVDFVREQHEKWGRLDNKKATMSEVRGVGTHVISVHAATFS